MNFEAIKDLLFRLADDDLLVGHRMSEWTGIGPILEEDIAFSSMAQDEIGHANAYYTILNEFFDEAHPDQIAFNRPADQFRCAQLVEYPIGDYAFSLIRHAAYDLAEAVRLHALSQSAFMPLAELAKKLAREEKYHQLHAQTWVKQLGNSTPEANARLQQAVNEVIPMAYGLFEPTDQSAALESDGIIPSEENLQAQWEEHITNLLTSSGLKMPVVEDKTAHYGGRKGVHTEHLAPLLAEMGEVFAIDPQAQW